MYGTVQMRTDGTFEFETEPPTTQVSARGPWEVFVRPIVILVRPVVERLVVGVIA